MCKCLSVSAEPAMLRSLVHYLYEYQHIVEPRAKLRELIAHGECDRSRQWQIRIQNTLKTLTTLTWRTQRGIRIAMGLLTHSRASKPTCFRRSFPVTLTSVSAGCGSLVNLSHVLEFCLWLEGARWLQPWRHGTAARKLWWVTATCRDKPLSSWLVLMV